MICVDVSINVILTMNYTINLKEGHLVRKRLIRYFAVIQAVTMITGMALVNPVYAKVQTSENPVYTEPNTPEDTEADIPEDAATDITEDTAPDIPKDNAQELKIPAGQDQAAEGNETEIDGNAEQNAIPNAMPNQDIGETEDRNKKRNAPVPILSELPPVVFEDDFSSGFSKWEAFQNEQMIRAEEDVLKTNGSGNAQFSPKRMWFQGERMNFEYDFRITSGSAGIQFHMQNKTVNNYDHTGYIANVSSQGKVDLIKGQPAGRKTLTQASIPDFAKDSWIHARVEYLKEGGRIRIYYNDMDQPLIDVSDPDGYQEGYLGFIGMYGTAQFDNVKIMGEVIVETDEELKKAAESVYILYKPLRDAQELTLPEVPDGYSLSIKATEPEGFINNQGKILARPESGMPDQDVDVTLEIKEDSSGESMEKTLSVPVSAVYTPPAMSEDEIRERQEEFKRNSFGLFDHYVAGLTKDQDGKVMNDIDELAESLDVEQLARDAHDFGVEYMIFTVAHSQQRLLYPSEVSKRWRDDLRTSPGVKTYSDRDVIEELYQALKEYDIDLVLYLCTEDGALWSAEDKLHTGVDQCGGSADGSHAVYDQFENELADEIMKRYQGKIRGMWFDGFFIHYGQAHIGMDEERFHETLTAYDPGVILYGNIGSDFQYNAFPDSPACNAQSLELYRLGQTGLNSAATTEDARTWAANRHHICCTAGDSTNNWWASMKDENNSKYTKENWFLFLVMQSSVSEEGGLAVSFGNFPGKAKEQRNENIWEGNIYEVFTQMNRQYLDPIAESIKDKVPGKAYRSDHNSWLDREGWGVSTESADGKDVYLHIINAPADTNSMLIPGTDDRSVLGGDAMLLKYDGTRVRAGFERTNEGYRITLPDGESFHELDTVIKVQRIQKANPDLRTVLPGADTNVQLDGKWTPMNPYKGLNYDTYYGSRRDYIYTNSPGSTYTRTFTGNRVEWYGVKARDHGKAGVYIDGEMAAQVDARTDLREDNALLFRSELLEDGEHTIQIKCLESAYLEIYALHAVTEPDGRPDDTGKDELQSLFNENRERTGDLYTIGSFAAFDGARANTLRILLDLTVDDQKIQTAYETLKETAAGLKKRAADSELKALSGQVQAALPAEEKGEEAYTAKSWSAFENALETARNILQNPQAYSSKEVAEAEKALKDAGKGLVPKPDRSPLQKAVENAMTKDLSQYTEQSVQVLNALLEKAQILLKASDEEIREEDLKKLAGEIDTAVDALELKKNDPVKEPENTPDQEPEKTPGKEQNPSEKNGSGNSGQGGDGPGGSDSYTQAVQTGDSAPILPFVLMCILALSSGGFILHRFNRKNKFTK